MLSPKPTNAAPIKLHSRCLLLLDMAEWGRTKGVDRLLPRLEEDEDEENDELIAKLRKESKENRRRMRVEKREEKARRKKWIALNEELIQESMKELKEKWMAAEEAAATAVAAIERHFGGDDAVSVANQFRWNDIPLTQIGCASSVEPARLKYGSADSFIAPFLPKYEVGGGSRGDRKRRRSEVEEGSNEFGGDGSDDSKGGEGKIFYLHFRAAPHIYYILNLPTTFYYNLLHSSQEKMASIGFVAVVLPRMA